MKTVSNIFAALLLLSIAACSRTATPSKPADVDYYTCTMHTFVHVNAPGKCPVCSMDLVPVMKRNVERKSVERGATSEPSDASRSNAPRSTSDMPGMPGMQGGNQMSGASSHEFVVPVERQQQIGVTYATVTRAPLHHTIRAVGMVDADMRRHWAFVARVDGYVQELFVPSAGQLVDKEAPLMSIYSPDLLTTERELVMLLRMRDEAKSKDARTTPERLIASAESRLRQWNITDEQIAELEQKRHPIEALTLRSPFRGVVQEVAAHQGVNVKVGDHLIDIADLSVVWVSADFYENELSMLQTGQGVIVTANSYPNERFEGQIAVINPFVEQTKRTAKVRIDIPNPDFKLRPGMYANVELAMDMGEALTIPVSAVMPTGTRNVVFVDKGEGKLEPRIVQLGAKYGDLYEVRGGLTQAERVVSSANFLIDAESKVQGALKDFEGMGTSAETEKRRNGEPGRK